MTKLNRRKKKNKPERKVQVGCRSNIHIVKSKERNRKKKEEEDE